MPLLHRIPGLGLIRRQRKGQGIFLLCSFLAYLLILILQWDLVLISLRSLAVASALLVRAPHRLREIFSIEIIEFWVAAIVLLAMLPTLALISEKSAAKAARQNSDESRNESSLGSISLQAFMRNTIAQSAAAVVFVLYSVACLAPLLAPFSPYDQQDFLVTAYKPPLTRLQALVLLQPKIQAMPVTRAGNIEDRMAASLIGDLRTLKTRNEPNALKFVDGYRIENGTVTYLQGMRTRTMPVEELADRGGKTPEVTRTFVLGTDQYGRDILSRVIYGSRISLSIGFLVVLISVTLGTVIGISSGYFGGWIDAVLMRIVDVLIAFPALFLILIIIAAFGNSIYLIVITLSFTGWMGVARIVRSQVLSLKEQEFILAAKALGLSSMRIIFRHLAPNTLTPVIIAATLRIGSIILTEAGLSFLGLGVQPPTPSWGNIINEGRDSLLNHWWISTFPGIAILTTVICFNLIGDGVRDALDPRMRGQS
ncbi:ABC transporter permease [Chlorobium sp.]|uniref:ABC transporter permease n=1 Tax=Chlorobium sp. TaxID=1095 RepID=UPI003C61F992